MTNNNISTCGIKALWGILYLTHVISLWWKQKLGHTASQGNVCADIRDSEHLLSLTRSAPSNSLLTDTKTPISTCASLRPSLCRKTPTVSSSCSLSDSWCSITSLETQACGQPTCTASAATVGVFHWFSFFLCRQRERQLVAKVRLSNGLCREQSEDSYDKTQLFEISVIYFVSLLHFVFLDSCRTQSGWWLRIPSSNWPP